METYKFKALVGKKFGGVCYTINPSFYEYSRIGQFINTNVPIKERRQRKRNVKREEAIAEYLRTCSQPGWTNPVCEYMPGSILIEPTDVDNIVFITISEDKPVDILEGQTRFGGSVSAVKDAIRTKDSKLRRKLETETNGVDLIPFVNCATSLQRFTDMGTSRACDTGYLKLTSSEPKYKDIKYVYENSHIVNSMRVAMSKDEFATGQDFMMYYNQLFVMLTPLIKVMDDKNILLNERVEIIDLCFKALGLPQNFRLKSKTNHLLEHATVLKQVFFAFAEMLEKAPQSYRDKLDNMFLNADWSKKNQENIGGLMDADCKVLTGHKETQIKLYVMYMLELEMSKKDVDKMRKLYKTMNVRIDSNGNESRYNADLPVRWTRRCADISVGSANASNVVMV